MKAVVIHQAFSCLTSTTYIFLLYVERWILFSGAIKIYCLPFRFDSAGPGSGACLRRYSDPTYFKRVCSSVEPVIVEKIHKVRKTHRSKVYYLLS